MKLLGTTVVQRYRRIVSVSMKEYVVAQIKIDWQCRTLTPVILTYSNHDKQLPSYDDCRKPNNTFRNTFKCLNEQTKQKRIHQMTKIQNFVKTTQSYVCK